VQNEHPEVEQNRNHASVRRKTVDTISTDKAPAAVGPYSQAVRCGDFVFCSGQLPIDPGTGKFAGDDIESQTVQVIRNLKSVLAAAGLDLSHAVKTTIFLTDMGKFSAVNEIYAREFGQNKPARATVEVSNLPLGALIEMECVAFQSR
jgi:2-iminobutanoate/2-iminopropanoate deaminase